MLWRMTLPGCHAAAAWSLLSGCWLGDEAHLQPMEALRAAQCSSACERTPPVRLLTAAVLSASAGACGPGTCLRTPPTLPAALAGSAGGTACCGNPAKALCPLPAGACGP